jgi:hypothetical protein
VRADREAPRRAGTAAWIGYPIGLLYEQPNRSLTQLAACLKLELTDYRLGHSILARRRYLTVRPHGFELHPGERLRPVLAVRILGFGSARTLHQNRKPLCRSLDAIRPTTAKREHRTCAEYALRTRCTSQVRLDLLVDTQPWRLLLAHTSEWPIPS